MTRALRDSSKEEVLACFSYLVGKFGPETLSNLKCKEGRNSQDEHDIGP